MSDIKKIDDGGHTQGPWADIKGYIVVKGGRTLASVNSHNTSEGKANARLVAAAPDLLEAAKEIAAWAEQANPAGYGGLGKDLHRKVLAAISKATGTPAPLREEEGEQ